MLSMLGISVLVTVLGCVIIAEGCMLPQPAPPAQSLHEAVGVAPIVVYGRVLYTHDLGEPVEPIQFQVYCSYNLNRPLVRTNEITFKGDFLGNSCAFTEMQREMEYIVLLQPCAEHPGMLEIFKATQTTPASWESTMENLNTVANTLCADGVAPAGTPPYLVCPQPRDDCVPPPPIPLYTTRATPTDKENKDEVTGAPEGQAEAAVVAGGHAPINLPCFLVLAVLLIISIITSM